VAEADLVGGDYAPASAGQGAHDTLPATGGKVAPVQQQRRAPVRGGGGRQVYAGLADGLAVQVELAPAGRERVGQPSSAMPSSSSASCAVADALAMTNAKADRITQRLSRRQGAPPVFLVGVAAGCFIQ